MSQTPASYQPYTPGRPGPEDEDAARQRSYGGAPDCLVVASIVCVVIWATSGFGYFWPIWVLLPTFLPTLLSGPRRWSVGRACRQLEGPKKERAAASVSGHLRRRGRS